MDIIQYNGFSQKKNYVITYQTYKFSKLKLPSGSPPSLYVYLLSHLQQPISLSGRRILNNIIRSFVSTQAESSGSLFRGSDSCFVWISLLSSSSMRQQTFAEASPLVRLASGVCRIDRSTERRYDGVTCLRGRGGEEVASGSFMGRRVGVTAVAKTWLFTLLSGSQSHGLAPPPRVLFHHLNTARNRGWRLRVVK